MDKKNAIRRGKRPSKVVEENYWDCSVCTYRNNAEAFKCSMCDVRKGNLALIKRYDPPKTVLQLCISLLHFRFLTTLKVTAPINVMLILKVKRNLHNNSDVSLCIFGSLLLHNLNTKEQSLEY